MELKPERAELTGPAEAVATPDTPTVRVPPHGSRSVSRAAAILNLVASRPGGWSLTQIASALGLAKSSTLSIMTSLEAAGLVCRTDNVYELDVGVLAPAGGFLRGVDVVSHFKRQLASSKVLGAEIAHLALLMGTQITYIARHIGRAPLPVTASVGDRFPAAITAAGTILLAQLSDDELAGLFGDPAAFPRWTPRSTPDLAHLMVKIERTRAEGFATDDGETHSNVLGMAVVVHRPGNHAQDFSLSASLLRDRVTTAGRRAALAELHQIRDALQTGNDLR